jgi:anti-sigma B factor antagonist
MVDDIFEVEIETRPDAVVLRLIGELDLYTASRLREPADAALDAELDVVFDLTGLVFVDSTGIADLARFHKRITAQGRAMSVVGPQPHVYRVLEISGLIGPLNVER